MPEPLKIDGKEIKMEKSARFLGVIFDSRLNWAEHINYLVEKCNKRLNCMRAIAGTKWGANRKLLLMLYRGLIRSVLDYGSIAFNSASAHIKAKLDVIHHKALRKAAGAFKTTANAALEVELCEPPLSIRRKQLTLKYAVKVLGTPNHPAAPAFQQQAINNRRIQTVSKTAQDFLASANVIFHGPRYDAAAKPPWLRKQCTVDTSLTAVLNTSYGDQIKKALACDVIDRYGHCLHYYTDGSRLEDGRTAAAVYSPATDSSIAARLTDKISIYAAELTAIRLALEWAQQVSTDNSNEIVIFSDSLSSLISLQAGHCASRPNLLEDVLQFIDRLEPRVHLVWLPSHCGIFGNEKADKSANGATRRATVDLHVGYELDDGYSKVKSYIINEWQKQWTRCKTGAFLRHISPTVNKPLRPCLQNRAKDVLITRLRFGKCKLNSYLAQIRKAPNADCKYGCRSPETVEHFLMHCSSAGNPVSGKLKMACQTLGLLHDLKTVLTDARLIVIITSARLDRDL